MLARPARLARAAWDRTPGVRRYLARTVTRSVAALMLEGRVPLAVLTHDCSRTQDCPTCRRRARNRFIKAKRAERAERARARGKRV